MLSGQKAQDMGVIFRAAYLNCGRIVFVKNAREISMHPLLCQGIRQQWETVFCRKNDVNQDS